MTALTDEQLDQFREDGYLVLPPVFTSDEVARMRAAADDMLNLILNSSIALGRKSGRLTWGLQADGTDYNCISSPRRIMIYSHYPGRIDTGHDIRNGPARQREQVYEKQYHEMVQRGDYDPIDFTRSLTAA